MSLWPQVQEEVKRWKFEPFILNGAAIKALVKEYVDLVPPERLPAGANLNAKDYDGNTPLHEIYLTDVEEELLRLGANVNPRTNEGETPIFTAAEDKGPQRQEVLRKAATQAKAR